MEILGLIGYSTAAIAYLIFLLLIFVGKQQGFTNRLMMLACLGSFAAALISTLQMYYSFSLPFTLLIEAIKICCWSVLLLSLNNGVGSLSEFLSQPQLKKYLIICGLGIAIAAIEIIQFQQYSWVFIILLAFNLTALVLLEQLYRNHKNKFKWAIWPLIAGLGGVFVFDFIIYAQASLLTRIDFDFWYGRGYIAIFALPFIVLSSKRIKGLSPDLFISRDVVFYSSILVLSGLYLILLAFSGYVIRYIGGQWSDLLSIIFMALGSLVLFSLLITSSLRNKVKVFISKHFFANKYDYRLEWLNVISAIEGQGSVDFYKTATRAMAACLQVNYCGFVKSTHRQLEVAYRDGLNFPDPVIEQLQLIDNFCQQQHWIIDVREYQAKNSIYQGLVIDAPLLISHFIEIIVPTYNQQQLLGYFVSPGPVEKPILNWEDRDYLFAVSKQLGSYLSLQQAQLKLAQNQQLSAFHRMSAFVLHDLKNIQAQLALINTNAEKHQQNPEFIDDVFTTVASAGERLDKVVKQLQVKSGKSLDKTTQAHGLVELPIDPINLGDVFKDVLQNCRHRQPVVSVNGADDLFLEVDKERLLDVLIHLVQNAQEACQADGWVKINAKQSQQRLIITISDNGCGMSEEFIATKLFKPFNTTKGNAGMGIGVFEAKQFIEDNNGVLSVVSEIDKGCEVTLNLPVSLTKLRTA